MSDPECRKLVLAKYLVDHVLPESATVCYFFFEDQDQNTVRQALCALLHQLFSKKPDLLKHAMRQYEQDGKGLVYSMKLLWTVLESAVRESQAEPVIIVLDGLDECAESEFEDLMRNIECQSRNSLSSRGAPRYLMTSCPYEQIVGRFHGLLKSFPRIHIPREEESDTISQGVNHVINYRVERMAEEKGFEDNIKADLAGSLLSVEHRTYLWVHLVFDYLKSEGLQETRKGIRSAMKSLPTSVNKTYEKILTRSKHQSTVRKALAIMLAASRPLTLSKLSIAMELDDTIRTIQELNLEKDEKFKLRIKRLCGLFVSVHHNKVYFIHQTAREFLLGDLIHAALVTQGKQWQYSITMQCAHKILAECCMRFISFFNSEASLSTDKTGWESYDHNRHAFFGYCGRFWPMHYREAQIEGDRDQAILILAFQISDPHSRCYSEWLHEHSTNAHRKPYDFYSQLILVSFFGHYQIVGTLLDKGADVNVQGGDYGNALQTASERGHEQVVKLLLNKGAQVNALGEDSSSAL
ncbi:hypothetical protein N0V95_007106 [Ascochyta clinopodiicola]|nr:hypothetical protein N0V95_007106 [Ascochyta clinopodiicola]